MSRRRPVIGIATDLEDGRGPRAAKDKAPFAFLKLSYLERVIEAGGAPVLLPPSEDLSLAALVLEPLDALLVTGSGVDVPASLFGEDSHPKQGRLVPFKTQFEIALVRAALAADLPLLGICNGMQVLNVACGGTLWQDLPSQCGLVHHGEEALPRHGVLIERGTRVHGVIGSERTTVNSSHHQAVRTVGKGLTVTGKAEDGTVEAIEEPTRRFALGVQWHPELIPGEAGSRHLFAALVEAARERREGPAAERRAPKRKKERRG